MSEFKTTEGLVEVDVNKYENIAGIYDGQDTARAKPVGHSMPIEANGGGSFDFSVHTITDYLSVSKLPEAVSG